MLSEMIQREVVGLGGLGYRETNRAADLKFTISQVERVLNEEVRIIDPEIQKVIDRCPATKYESDQARREDVNYSMFYIQPGEKARGRKQFSLVLEKPTDAAMNISIMTGREYGKYYGMNDCPTGLESDIRDGGPVISLDTPRGEVFLVFAETDNFIIYRPSDMSGEIITASLRNIGEKHVGMLSLHGQDNGRWGLGLEIYGFNLNKEELRVLGEIE